MASDPKKQKKDPSKLMLILAAGGGLSLIHISEPTRPY